MQRRSPRTYTDQLRLADDARIEMQAIGHVASPFRERYAAPHQPGVGEAVAGSIRLLPGHNYEQAVKDLEGFSHIWVLYWMHLNDGWNPTVIPPRGSRTRRGLFATRAPHRPNRIGLSVVELVAVKGLELTIRNFDMLDGSPVLDIKPYIAYADSIPHARSGWLETEGLSMPTSAPSSAPTRDSGG